MKTPAENLPLKLVHHAEGVRHVPCSRALGKRLPHTFEGLVILVGCLLVCVEIALEIVLLLWVAARLILRILLVKIKVVDPSKHVKASGEQGTYIFLSRDGFAFCR